MLHTLNDILKINGIISIESSNSYYYDVKFNNTKVMFISLYVTNKIINQVHITLIKRDYDNNHIKYINKIMDILSNYCISNNIQLLLTSIDSIFKKVK